MLTDFGRVFIFFLIGVVFVAGGLVMAWVIRPKRPYAEKLSSYECGEEAVGTSRIKFNIRFYVIALIFLIFEVETVFLFPWALVYKDLGMFAFVEMLLFLFILFVGYAHVWARGDLDWDRPIPVVPVLNRGGGAPLPAAAKTPVSSHSI